MRLTQLLNAEKDKTSIERARQIATDTYLLPAEKIKELLFAAYQRRPAGAPADPVLAEAMEVLRAWNNRMDVEQSGATLMALLIKTRQQSFDFFALGVVEAAGAQEGDRLLEWMAQVARNVQERFGSVQAPYGKVHRYRYGGKELPLPGLDSYTLRAGGARLDKDLTMEVLGGSSFSMVVDLRQPVKAWSMLPYGESHRPASKHYNDQMEVYAQRQYKPAWFTDEEVLANTESRQELVIQRAAAAAAAR